MSQLESIIKYATLPYPIYDVTEDNDGNVYAVCLNGDVMVFKDGQELPLDHQNSMFLGGAVLMGGSGKEVAIANQVATFLGVPFQEIAPPIPGMGLGTGINIGGIQL